MIDVSKSTIDQYILRKPQPSGWWALINVDEAHGALMIQSDYGDFSYRWGTGGLGCPFREFLAGRAGVDYLMDKMFPKDFFDEESTSNQLSHLVIEARKQGDIDSEVARYWYDFIQETLRGRTGHIHEYVNIMRHDDSGAGAELWKWFDGMPPLDLGYHPRAHRFFNEIWPEFVKVLKAEISPETDHKKED